MRLQIVKSKNAASLYAVKSIFENGKRTSKVVEKLGTYDELLKKLDGQDPIEWGKRYIEELNNKEKEEKREVLVKYSPVKQITLRPLEQKNISDFGLSKFIVCTDAGLASAANCKFNNIHDKAFITTQSIKKLKSQLKDWALDTKGWHISDSNKVYDLAESDEKADIDKIFYKQRWINEDGLEQNLIVTFSLKYRNYQQTIRNRQVERAQKVIDTNPKKLKKCNANDYKRFISKSYCTTDGEVADKELYGIDTNLIAQESVYDGFYAVCTNLEDDASSIIKVNRRRWEIEESFRIMKSEFRARPVYLQRDDRIKAHFKVSKMRNQYNKLSMQRNKKEFWKILTNLYPLHLRGYILPQK